MLACFGGQDFASQVGFAAVVSACWFGLVRFSFCLLSVHLEEGKVTKTIEVYGDHKLSRKFMKIKSEPCKLL